MRTSRMACEIWLAVLMMVAPGTALAKYKWVLVDRTSFSMSYLDVSHVVLNGNGNRVATLRTVLKTGGYMDIVGVYDCTGRRERSLASASFTRHGRLIAATGPDKEWMSAEHGSGFAAACRAALKNPG